MLNVRPRARLRLGGQAGRLRCRPPTSAGMRLVFGYLAGGPAPFETVRPETSFILAFQALPLILVISALSALLYHWGVLQVVVRAVGWVLQRSLGVSGPVGTSAAANVFVGMVEAPLLVRPYLAAHEARRAVRHHDGRHGRRGGHRAGPLCHHPRAGAAGCGRASDRRLRYQGAGGAHAVRADGAGRAPRGGRPSGDRHRHRRPAASSMDAIAQGTREGIELLVNVTAMLVVIVALVALANQLVGFVTAPFGVRSPSSRCWAGCSRRSPG